MEPNSIKCPKCASTQLFFDKKGFSGKKAVVGAVLTGGIGLLAGTLGSNKVVASCLACGNKFSPVKRNTIDIKKPITNKEHEFNMWFFGAIAAVLFIIFIIFVSDSGFTLSMFVIGLLIAYFAYMSYCSYWISKKPAPPNQTSLGEQPLKNT